MANSNMSMKLLIDTQAKRVVFAEANKECVDFLFHLLSLPVANIVRLLRKQGTLGPLAKLYESIENLNDSYIQPNHTKDAILKPATPIWVHSLLSPPLTPNDVPVKKFYTCECTHIFSDDRRALCPNCLMKTTFNLRYMAPLSDDHGGFVKGAVTYIVMDDLEVKPMSTVSTLPIIISLQKLNVKDVNSLEEKVVNLGMNEALKLLKATLQSTEKVLTDVFLMGSCCKANLCPSSGIQVKEPSVSSGNESDASDYESE